MDPATILLIASVLIPLLIKYGPAIIDAIQSLR